MFLEFYNLREQPFGVTPDPRYLYLSAGHREALASLLYGIETGRGFLSLIAEPGMGKTTILFQVLKRFYIHSAFLFQTQCNSREFLCYLLEDLGLANHDRDMVRMHSELNDFLYRESQAGNPVVVVIDEAQNLSDRVLETVRLLSDFESPERKLVQIVLAGQPGLASRLSHPGLAQLRQRISIQARLEPLYAVEVAGYINHRLQVAGYRGRGLFTPGALQLIAERSGGIPRIVNNLCFNALSMGCAMRCEKIGTEVVQEVAMELSLDTKAARAPVSRPRLSGRAPSTVRTELDPSLSAIGSQLFRQKTFQISFLSALLVSAIFFGFWSRATKQTPVRTPSKTSPVLATPELAPDSQKPAPRGLSEAQSVETQPSTDRGASVAFFTYVVEPHDTLRELCTAIVGQYDSSTVAEIQKLNPGMRDPNHLEAGQALRFPLKRSEIKEVRSRMADNLNTEKASP